MTGIDMLEKILEAVEELKISVGLINANLQVLNNRAGGLLKDKLAQPIVKSELSAGVPIKESSFAPLPVEPEKSGVRVYKKVFGKLINNGSEPIEGVLIKIYDKSNEVCATTETDPVGYWETMLTIGRYTAEYTKVGFKTANKTFDVMKNIKEVEVK